MINPEIKVSINAPTAVVWEVLVQLDNYVDWNPYVKFQGEACKGTAVPMTVKLFNRSITVPAMFETVEAEQELRWRGGPRGLLSGSHYFKIIQPDGEPEKTDLIQGEVFTGIALPILWPFLKKELHSFYNGINNAITNRAESMAAR